ncbi:MAG: TolC family protein [Candidatus Binataceae bacterium]
MANRPGRALIAATLCSFVLCLPRANAADAPIQNGERLTLGRAIELALRDNPSRLAIASDTAAAGEVVGQARAMMMPQVLGGSEYLRSTHNGVGDTSYLSLPGFPRIASSNEYKTGPSSQTDDNYLAGASAFQYLLDFGRARGYVEQRRAEAASERDRLAFTDLDLIYETTQRYFAMLAAEQIVKVYEKAVEQRQEHLHESDLKAQAGLVPQIDVSTAQAELARASVHLLDSQNDVAKAKVALDNVMGLGPDAPDYGLAEVLAYHNATGSIPEYFKTALGLRPDFKMLAEQVRAAGAIITEYRSDYLPTVVGTADYSARGQGLPAANNFDVGIVVTWPIFNGFLTEHQVAEAKLRQAAIRHSIDDLQQRIYLEVKDAFLDWDTSVHRIHRAESALAASRAELELADKRYSAGLGNIVELTEAERQYTEDDATYVQALYAFSVSKAALDQATGQSLAGRY